MHLCTCVSEEGDDRETVHSETPSLLSYTLRYVSFTEVGSDYHQGFALIYIYIYCCLLSSVKPRISFRN